MRIIKLLIALVVLLPASAFAMTADIDCYYPNHEEHFKNADVWRPNARDVIVQVEDKWNLTYLSLINCIVREK